MAIPGVIQTGQVPGVKMGPMGIRAAAGARAVGAPKAAPKGVTKGAKVRTPPAKTAAPTKATPVKAAGFNYGNMTPPEATRYITQQVGAETKANLAPLKARQNEIGQTEGAVANRYQGYGEALTGGPRVPVGSSLLGGLQTTAGESAKTFQNNVAEEALRASKGVETAGQNALTASAGYVSPELRATLGNQMGNIAATGTAANQAAGAMGANEQNFLTNIRAAAAQRVTEGQRGIAGVYGKQRGEVQGKEQALLAREPGAIMKGVQGLLGEQSKIKTAREGLGLKVAGLQQKETQSQRTARVSRENAAEKTRATERGQNITQAHYERADSISRARAEAANKKAAKGGLTTPQQDKAAGDIGTAFNTIQTLRMQGVPESRVLEILSTGSRRAAEAYTGKKGEKLERPVSFRYSKVTDPLVQRAGLEMWKRHALSAQTEAALHARGIGVTGRQLAEAWGIPYGPQNTPSGVTGRTGK